MKIFAVKDNEVPLNLSANPYTEFFNRTITLPLCIEDFEEEEATAKNELLEIQEVFRNSNADDQITLKLEKIEGEGNSSASEGRRRLLRVEGSFLNELKNIYDNIRIIVIIDGLRWPVARTYNSYFHDSNLSDSKLYQGASITTLETNEMEVCDASACENASTKFYCKQQITLPALWSTEFERVLTRTPAHYGIHQYCIRVTITVELSSEIPQIYLPVKKMLEEGIETDAVLVAACGSEIKCHKSFLSVNSTELGKNFQNDFKESKTGRIEMVDMSKEGIGAFLEYLYYLGTDKPEEDSGIALELFQAAHKYNVVNLERKMKQILLRKQNDWYDVNVALKLFLFSRNLDGCENVTKKSVMVLKSKYSQLKDSEEYENMFLKDYKAAMQLCASAFSI